MTKEDGHHTFICIDPKNPYVNGTKASVNAAASTPATPTVETDEDADLQMAVYATNQKKYREKQQRLVAALTKQAQEQEEDAALLDQAAGLLEAAKKKDD